MPTLVKRQATLDPSLRAEVTSCRPLHYSDGADPSLDRPAHVRAASSLQPFAGGYAVVQDDANFIALLKDDTVHALTLPSGEGGLRQFDSGRGNKRYKLDLEASIIVPDEELLVAFGSGSSPYRGKLVLLHEEGLRVEMFEAAELYRLLREHTDFSGSELNLEGAVLQGDTLRLFSRGNGAARGELKPVNSSCDLPWSDFAAYLHGDAPCPLPQNIIQYDLGILGGLPLGFTDVTPLPDGRILYSAAAEDSPDATEDGVVTGSVLGVLEGDSLRYTPLMQTGELFVEKVEGLTLRTPTEVLIVLDKDDPAVPSELCVVKLWGSW